MGPRNDLTGEVVGNYRIESLIDEGGMGRVYRGRHIHLNRPAAIKIMLPELEVIPGYRARFLQEARAAAALRHPNVVEIYECGEQGGRFYLAMELIPDGSLLNLMRGQKQRPDQRPFSLALGLDLVRQAAVGLEYAHKRGMVHRDVKPANLLLEARGQDSAEVIREGREAVAESYTLKVSDFGLARLKEGGVETTIGKVRGTLAYMSPEQCRGQELDGRSDLYALGIILFELATGKRPFAVKTPADAIYKHINEPPPTLRSLRPELPEELDSLVQRCLAKDPKDRYFSCASLAASLQSLVDRGVLAEEATQLDEHPEVTASLHSIPLGVVIEPPEILDGLDGEEDEGKGIDRERENGSPESGATVRSGPSLPRVRLYDRQGATIKVLDLTGEGLTVGRLTDNDFALETVGVSRHHLRIDWDGSDASVTDLGSHNGTFRRDGARLAPGVSHSWQPLESLRIGRYWLRLEMTTSSAAAALEPSASISDTAIGARTATEVEGVGEVEPIVEPTIKGIEEKSRTASAPTASERVVASEETELHSVGPIELSLDPVQLRLTPSLPGRVSVVLTNRGDTAERLGVLVEGAPAEWVTGKGEDVLVGPGEERTLALTVLVPPVPSSRAGDYPVVIRATRRAAARGEMGEEQSALRDASAAATITNADGREKLPFTASGRWTVTELVKHSLVLLPERLRALRVAEYQIKIENDGNSESTLELSVTEPEVAAEALETGEGKPSGKAETLIYEFSQPKVSLEPGQTTEVTLRVTAPTRLVGPEEARPFEVSAKASDVGPPITAKAELVRRALVPLWAIFAAALLFVLTAVAVLAYATPGLQPIVMGVFQGPPQPPTAEAALPSPTPPAVVQASPTDTPASPRAAEAEVTPSATPTPQAAESTSTATAAPLTTTAEPASPTPTETPVGTPTQTKSNAPVAPPTPTKTPTRTPTPTNTPTNTPCPKPVISFAFDRPEIVASQSDTLRWTVTGADQVSIDNSIGSVSAASSQAVTPAPTTASTVTVTYTLTATRCGVPATKQAAVKVYPKPVPVVFKVSPSPIVPYHSAKLEWDVTGADQVSIDHGVVASSATGSAYVAPGATTTYTLTAKKLDFTTTKTATLSVYTHATVTVNFTSVYIENDADPSGSGEIWLDFNVNGATARWPNSGTQSCSSGSTYGVGRSFSFTFYPSSRLSIYVNGTDEDSPTWGDPNDPLGTVSRTYYGPPGGWDTSTSSGARSTCPDGCYTIYYTISTTWLP